MAIGFTFNSPGSKFNEIDLTPQVASLGITVLGLVGETQKGRAFEPTFISNKNDFRKLFGAQSNEKLGTSLKYVLPFYANSYLTEGNQLWVTRVLGLSGYDAGTGWALKVNAGLDQSTTSITATVTASTTFTGGTFLGVSINANGLYSTTGSFVKNGSTFSATTYIINVTNYNSTILSGSTTYSAQTVTGSAFSAYEDMVVGVVRSRGLYVNNSLLFNASAVTLSLSGAGSNLLGNFVLTTQGLTNEAYTCTLDPDSTSFIPNVIGDKPKGKNTALYVESIYPDLIKKLNSLGSYFSLSPTLVTLSTDVFTDYEATYATPVTPWIVSELRGSKVEKLFRFISISDGDAANKEIKVSFQRLNFDTKEFDVIIRDFNDTDNNVVVLESYTRCSLDPTLPNYVGKRIGSRTEGNNDFDNDVQGNYVYLEIAMPCGFEGYYLRNYSASNTGSVSANTPTVFYKTSYSSSDKKSRVYLGISERGYDTTSNGQGINQNYFNYAGAASVSTSFSKTKGFHLDSGATLNYVDGDYTIGLFSTGAGQLQTSLDTISGVYSDLTSRKFTVVPYGGFDGWDVHRTQRTNNGAFVVGRANYVANNDYDAYLTGINMFDNPEETPLTLFATPGINWYDHIDLVNDAIEVIERTRQGDALYVIDAPDMTSDETAQDIVDKLETVDIDSNYSATYAPYIQVYDADSGTNQYIPPTGEVLRVMAYTDKVRFPWFAPAGVNRGLIPSAKQVRKKFSEPERDILYPGRINPIAKFNDIGVDIFGQKTLQIKQSALDRINVRRLLIYAKFLIRRIAKGLIFEPNDDVTINEFIGKVNPILANIQRERGLRSFKVQLSTDNTPESRDRNELYFDLVLVPTSTLEYVGVTFIVTPSSVQFNS
jgi:hypothetical protein